METDDGEPLWVELRVEPSEEVVGGRLGDRVRRELDLGPKVTAGAEYPSRESKNNKVSWFPLFESGKADVGTNIASSVDATLADVYTIFFCVPADLRSGRNVLTKWMGP